MPGLAMGIELIEYSDITGEPQRPHFRDPSTNMSFWVSALDARFANIEQHPA